MARDGWLGIAMPEQYGGAGLGITEAAVMMQAIAESGAGFSGASAVHMNIFGLNPVVVFGTEEQKRRMLPPLIRGEQRACFAVTEPNTGLNTRKIKTRAEKRGERYLVSGQKVWISTAQVAEKVLLLATTAAGLTLFYTDLDRRHVEVREIDKMGRHAVDSNQVFFDALPVPETDRIGEEGKGFEYILHGMNPERILIAAELVGLGRCAVNRAAAYAKERVVFDRPIGQNQAIQHPLAANWMALEAAEPDGVQGGDALRRRQALRRGGERREIPRRRGLLRRLPAGGDDPRRLRLRARIPRRALPARILRRPHRAGEPRAHPVLHRRARARAAEVVLAGMASEAGALAPSRAAGVLPGGAAAHGLLPPRRARRPRDRGALPLRRPRARRARDRPHRLGGSCFFGAPAPTSVPTFRRPGSCSPGPYRFTRNPMYLGMAGILLGVAIYVGSLTPFIVIPAFMALIQERFILPEEQKLEEAFGADYLAFKARIHRWL